MQSRKTVTETPVPEPERPKPKIITEDSVTDYIQQNPATISNYLRNERALKAQRKQMNAKSLLNNAYCFGYIIYSKRWRIKKTVKLSSIQANKLIPEIPENKKTYTSTS